MLLIIRHTQARIMQEKLAYLKLLKNSENIERLSECNKYPTTSCYLLSKIFYLVSYLDIRKGIICIGFYVLKSILNIKIFHIPHSIWFEDGFKHQQT